MKAATIKAIKEALHMRSPDDLVEICLRLARFKKENKELLTYLLYESGDESAYIAAIKREAVKDFAEINTSSYYYIKKSVRKILRNIKKYIRYSQQKETEVELLLFFCTELVKIKPAIKHNIALKNLYHRQVSIIRKTIRSLHEDLQYDYGEEIKKLTFIE